jgi:magnesium transporter
VGGYGALLGMNLKNYFEDDPYAFGLVTGFALLSGAGAFAVALKKLRTLAKIKPY